MGEPINDIINEANALLQEGKYSDAGRCYEKAAETTHHKAQAAKLLMKASEAYRYCRMYTEADRCSVGAVKLMDDNQKAQYLLTRWKEIIKNIVEFEYDCSFEWRGDTNGSHDSYLEDIKKLQKEGEDILKQVLRVNGVDKNQIIEKAREECKKWEEAGGWGSDRCWDIINKAT